VHCPFRRQRGALLLSARLRIGQASAGNKKGENNMRTVCWAVLAAATVVSAAASAITIGGGGDARPIDLGQTFDLAAAPATAAKTYIVSTGRAKDVRKVAILSYCVGVVYGKGVSGSSSGGTFSLTKTAVAGFPGGVPSGVALAAADAMYDQFEADLRAAGIEVVPYEQLAAMPSFQKLAGKMATAPIDVEEDLDLGKGKGGTNLLVVFSPKQRPFLKDCRQESPSTMTSKVKLGYEQDMEGITLASVKVTLDFAKPLAGGGFFQGAKADLQYGEYVVPGANDTGVQFMNKGGFGSYWLKQAIVPAENPFKVGGSGSIQRSGDYNPVSERYTTVTTQSTTVDADHVLWGSNAESHLKALSHMFVAALQSG
jgi:hypothetical protein